MMVGMEMRMMGVMALKAHGKLSRVLYVILPLPVKLATRGLAKQDKNDAFWSY